MTDLAEGFRRLPPRKLTVGQCEGRQVPGHGPGPAGDIHALLAGLGIVAAGFGVMNLLWHWNQSQYRAALRRPRSGVKHPSRAKMDPSKRRKGEGRGHHHHS